MLSDPIRQASLDAAAAIDRGPPLDADAAVPIPGQATFDEFVQALNPMHHIPVVGHIYRAVTGEKINPAFQVVGGALFGGIAGLITSALVALLQHTDIVADVKTVFSGDFHDPTELASSQQAQIAYAMNGGNSNSGA
jgi:hypothetical protein